MYYNKKISVERYSMNLNIKIYKFSAFILAALLTVCRILALIFDFDYALGYFDRGIFAVLFHVVTLIAVIWLLTPMLLITKGSLTIKKPRSVLSSGAMASSAVLIGISGFVFVLTNFSFKEPLPLLCGIFLIAGACYPVCRLLVPKKRDLSVYMGIAAIVSLVLVTFILHFDQNTPVNSSLKNSMFYAVIASALFLLSELRILFDDAMPRAFLSAKLITIVLCLPTAVGNLVLYFSEKTPVLMKATLSPFLSLPLFALALYAAFGTFRAIKEK